MEKNTRLWITSNCTRCRSEGCPVSSWSQEHAEQSLQHL